MFLFLPVGVFSQTPVFNADSVYSFIHHLSVTIGPRPMGSLNERIALDWAAEKFRSFGADSAYVMTFRKVEAPRSSVNTHSGTAVGIFRGKSDSTIVVGGHIDSDGREIPGANDNASGTATAIELARIWSRRERNYTMVFAAFGGEERGLVGSEYFVDHYSGIDDVVLMISADMTGADDKIVTIFETDSGQAPVWLVRDAFALDRELGINRLQYPTHFSTINNIGDGAGSDHMPFLNRHIPAIDFTVGFNHSPIHTPQDIIDFISKPMLDRCGRLVDGLLQKYQEHGIPVSENGPYMMWQMFGFLVFIPSWVILIFNVIALLMGIRAFLYSRKNRLRIEKKQRVRFSGLKLFLMMIIIAIFAEIGDDILQLFKGLRYPWVNNINGYIWFAVLWSIAGLWIVLQLTRKWRFSPDPYVYTKRALIILFIYIIPAGLASMRLALYPALSFTLISLAILIPVPWIKLIFSFLAPVPMFRLLFVETFTGFTRMSAFIGLNIDSFLEALLYSAVLTVILVIWCLPFIYLYAYILVDIGSVKTLCKVSRRPAFGLIILLIVIGYGGFLYSLPAYGDMWRPLIRVEAEYDMGKKESELKLIGNEHFLDVSVKTDSLDQRYEGRTHKEVLAHSFTADWFHVRGHEAFIEGEKDTVTIDWKINSSRPWYDVTLTIRVDTLEIDSVHSELNFNHRKDRVTFSWSNDPPESLRIASRLTIPSGAKLIREVSASYPEMPIPIQVESDLANIRYRTRVTVVDTLDVSGEQDR